MIQDTIEYYIKNKNIKESDISEIIVLEEVISDKSLNISSINKLAISLSVDNTNILNFEYNKEIKTIEISMLINGQIEYLTKASEIKLFKFSIPKCLLIPFNDLKIFSKINSSDVYIHESICRKLTCKSFYISLLVDLNLDTL